MYLGAVVCTTDYVVLVLETGPVREICFAVVLFGLSTVFSWCQRIHHIVNVFHAINSR